MTKSTIGLATLGIGATTAVTAPVAMKLGGGFGRGEDITPEKFDDDGFWKPDWQEPKIKLSSLKNIENIKDNYQNIDCLKDKFGNNINWNSGNVSTEGLSSSLNLNPSSVEGCLIVEYYKKTYEGNKWWGEFKLVWSLKDTDYGLVTIIHAKTKDKKLVVDSSIYILDKKDENWKIKYSKENKGNEASQGELPNLILKPGTSITDFKDNSDKYWNFDPDTTKVCGKRDCKGGSSETKYSTTWTFKGENGGNVTVNNLFSNFNDWSNKNFQETSLQSQILAVYIKDITKTDNLN